MSNLLRSCLCATLLALPMSGWAEGSAALSWFSPELRRIEAARQTLQQTLETLPPAPAPQFTQRLGWHSHYSDSAERVEWLELDLGLAEPLDSVVLVAPPPTGGRTEEGYGFPLRFRVELLGDDETTERAVIADHTREDFPNPGLLPVVIPAGGKVARKVRITATRLYREGDRYLCAFGEIMLWRGWRNFGPRIELNGPPVVLASSSQGTRPDWGRINVVDGQSVLGPPVGTQPSPTLGYKNKSKHEDRATPAQPWVSVDLGQVTLIDEVRLFPAHPPQFAHSHGYGFPFRYQIELREEPDGLPMVLPAPNSGDYIAPPADNVVTVVTAGRPARYVRLFALESHVSNGGPIFALAEMQVWADGKNVAAGKGVDASNFTKAPGWSGPALVDGFTSSGEIVDWPNWLAGLSQRREVLHQLAMLDRRRIALTAQWQRMGWITLAALVVVALVVASFWSLRQRRLRRAELEALRQRIARDLHDEIGSSLGSISLIAQDLLASRGDEAQARGDLQEIKEIADETVGAMRDITRLIQSDRYGTGDLSTVLSETAGRLLRGIDHRVTIESGEPVRGLPVDRQRDLVLMLKETLHNVTKHASASLVEVRLKQADGQLTLVVRDNGRGFDRSAPNGGGMGLTNLHRRASKHGGQVEVVSALAQGTTVSISVPLA